ncbi:hypothetical protein DV735_g2575, partial [Chaetothyriales sp. CBS 134920]
MLNSLAPAPPVHVRDSLRPINPGYPHLRALQAHLDNVLVAIQNRISEATSVRSERHRRTEAEADRAIERMRALLERINHLEEEFTKITKIKEVVKKLKQRVDETHERVERTSASRHGDVRSGDRSSGVRHADLAYRPRDRHR